MRCDERNDEAGDRDQQGGPEAVPEPRGEGDRGGMVVLEPEPALPRVLLHAPGVAEGLAEVDDDERARQGEGERGQAARDREPSPSPPGGDDERRQQEHARVLGARREADREPGELEPARDHERERDRDSERERHVRHGHARIGHIASSPPRRSGGDEAGDVRP